MCLSLKTRRSLRTGIELTRLTTTCSIRFSTPIGWRQAYNEDVMSLSRISKILGLDQARAWDRIAAYLWVPVILAANTPWGCLVDVLSILTIPAACSSLLLLLGAWGRHYVGALLGLCFSAPLLLWLVRFDFTEFSSTALLLGVLPLPIFFISFKGIARDVNGRAARSDSEVPAV